MTDHEAIRNLLANTDWSIAGIAFVLGVPVRLVERLAGELTP